MPKEHVGEKTIPYLKWTQNRSLVGKRIESNTDRSLSSLYNAYVIC